MVLCFASLLFGKPAPTHDIGGLQSFYIVSNFFSDYLPGSFTEILSVDPQDKDVRVQVIRISSANAYCSGSLVRAAERILPNTTPRKIARDANLCSYAPETVAVALKNAKSKSMTDTWDSSAETVVAKCGSEQRTFEFPFPAEVDVKQLERQSPAVFELWQTAYRVRTRTFGKKFTFNGLPAEEERRFEEQGTQSLATLKSGKFQDAFDGITCADSLCQTNYLAWLLRDYLGAPVSSDSASVDLVNGSSLHFAKYEAPRYPRIAETAHIQGEVRLSVSADPETGVVKGVRLVSGHKLLGEAAMEAAKKWQFAPGSMTTEPADIELKFDFHCPTE